MVDEVVDELAKDPRVAAAYNLWYELREDVLRTYKDNLPERLPLSGQKEFKRIKNLVILEALKLEQYQQVFHPDDLWDGNPDEHAEEAQLALWLNIRQIVLAPVFLVGVLADSLKAVAGYAAYFPQTCLFIFVKRPCSSWIRCRPHFS